MRTLLLAAVFLVTGALADDSSARTKLIGTWQPEDAVNHPGWTLEGKAGDTLRIVEIQGGQKVLEFECNPGHECEATEAGKPVKISIWFNGDRLVELETRGREVTKRRFSVAGQGEAMEIEVTPIVPEGKPEKVRLHRAAAK